MVRSRLIGIMIIGWYFVLAAFPAAIAAFIAMISDGPPDLHVRLPIFLSPILFGVSGVGILLQKQWGRLFAIIVSSIVTVYLVYTAIQCIQILSEHPEWTSSNTSFAIILIAIAASFLMTIFYLTRSNVREQFAKQVNNSGRVA